MEQSRGKPNIPVGVEFLKLIREQEAQCEATFEEWLPSAGVKAPQTLKALGTALSILDRIASCWWGCRGGDHRHERLIGRAVSNARATLLLLKSGYHDEGLGLVRQIGETANLLFLFSESEESFVEWTNATESERRQNFSAVKVRLKLAELTPVVPMDQDLYRQLSGVSVHTNPDTMPQNYNPLEVPTMGGYFQEAGAVVLLNELGRLIVFILWQGSNLLQQPADIKAALIAARTLLDSVGRASIMSIHEYWDQIRGTPEFQEMKAVMWQLQLARGKADTAHPLLSEKDGSRTEEDQ